jgi:O-antigen ligase
LSGVLAAVGVVVAAACAAAAILLPAGRLRAAAMLAALLLAPVLVLGDQWHSPQIVDLRHTPMRLVGLGLAGLALSAALAAFFRRWPILLPLAIVATLPFRVPLHAGGDTANLLVPLYVVIAGGVLSAAVRDIGRRPAAGAAGGVSAGCWVFRLARSFSRRAVCAKNGTPRPLETPPPPPAAGEADWSDASRAGGGEGVSVPTRRPLFRPADSASGGSSSGEKPSGGSDAPSPTGPARVLPLVLAAVVVLYALQALYSPDFSKSLQNVCFFFVPFSLVYALLRDVDWSRKLLVLVLWVVALEAVAFVVVGSVEYLSRDLFWNQQVIRSNDFHTYFRVNSIFWDPNIYGRYLALAIAIAMAALLWARERRTLALLTGLVAVLWLGLVPTFSQSSFVALLAGLAVLAALRSWRWTLAVVGVVAVFGVLVVLFAGGVSRLSPDRLNVETGGRAHLVSGGGELFARRPLRGWGAGGFPAAYKQHIATGKTPVSVSHTEPITVAAEQGLIGLCAYAALLVTALWTMSWGLFATRTGGGGGVNRAGPWSPAGRTEPPAGGGGGVSGSTPPAPPPARQAHGPSPHAIARAAILAAFVALLVHTMAYAGFYEDPIAWVLLAAGASLSTLQRRAVD